MWTPALCFALISFIYFADIFLRASRKSFWFDELFTVYLCRLPDFRATWTAVLHGADFNPPLFYLLTRGAQRLFGEGLIATRLPEMLGVWVFGVGLYLFVSRRLGRIPGLIAALLPFFTLIQFYAYEARPHGIVLGWLGLALICWQRADEGRAKLGWLVGFGLSLLGALLTHVYSVYLLVPFGVVELYSLWKKRRLDWAIVTTMAVALAAVLPVYWAMFRMYRSSGISGGLPGNPQDVLEHFFVLAIGPAIAIFILAVALFALYGRAQVDPKAVPPGFTQREVALAAAFGFIPFVAVVGIRFTKAPYFDRYFLSSIAGYAIFLALASFRSRPRAARILAACMLFLMVGDPATMIFHRMRRSDVTLTEPSSKFEFPVTPADPLSRDKALLTVDPQQDVLVLEEPSYLYFFTYAPAALVPHLYFGVPETRDPFFRGYGRLAKWAHIDLKLTTFEPFFASHKHLFVYANADATEGNVCGTCTQQILNAGYTLKSVRRDIDGLLYEYQR
jgi:4-amino-4-deoxy-L-arabinose transferase-like glycosyltransferase